jgi:hypothetical protein
LCPAPTATPSSSASTATWKPGDAYTTCGGLPGFVASQLGVSDEVKREGITGSGLAAMRDAAIKRGAWVHHSMVNRRLAGDA